MSKGEELTQEEIQRLLNYDQQTGQFTWLVKRLRAEIGSRADSRHHDGYYNVYIDGTGYLAHRLAWFWSYGTWPTLIDHKDCNPSNNRLSNLRPATHAQNSVNANRPLGSSSYKGVSLNKGKWTARIRVNGTRFTLGRFDTPDAAHEAYCEAARRLHGEFARSVI